MSYFTLMKKQCAIDQLVDIAPLKRRIKRYNTQIENLRGAAEINRLDEKKIAMLEKMVEYCEERVEILKAIYDAVPDEDKSKRPVIDIDDEYRY